MKAAGIDFSSHMQHQELEDWIERNSLVRELERDSLLHELLKRGLFGNKPPLTESKLQLP